MTEPATHVSELLGYRPELPLEQVNSNRRDWLNAALTESYSWLRDATRDSADLPKQISYLLGNQWDKRRPTYKAAPVNNRLLRSMEQTVAILTDIRQIFEVRSSDKLYNDQAVLMTDIVRSWWVKQNTDFQLAMALIYAYLGTGYMRVAWNPRLCNGMGDFEWQPLNLYELLPIGPTHDLQGWEGCIYESVRSVAWFRRNFPAAGSRVKASGRLSSYQRPLNRPQQLGGISFEMLSAQMQNWIGAPREFGESVVSQAWYREFWLRDWGINTSQNTIDMGRGNWAYRVKPGELLYPRGRLIVTGGDDLQVMYDGPNFFWHGRFPFIQLRLKPVPWQTLGLSELTSKIPLQDIVNTVLAGTLDMVKKAVNPALLYPDNAFSDAVKRNLDPSMPNAKIGYSPLAPQPPQFSIPPVLPSYVPNLASYAQQEMDDDSGLLDLASLGRKKITPAGDTLDSLKESQQTVMRMRGRYIETALRDGGEQMVPNFFQFYTMQRRMQMYGPKGLTYQDVFDANTRTLIPSGVEPMDHARIFNFEIAPGTLLAVNRTENQLLAMGLRRQGDISRKTLYEMMDMGSIYEKVKKELDEERAEMMEQAAAAAAQQAQAVGAPMPAHKMGKGSDNIDNLTKQ
jgi:hypothetical protein